jgi:hypothetical protein
MTASAFASRFSRWVCRLTSVLSAHEWAALADRSLRATLRRNQRSEYLEPSLRAQETPILQGLKRVTRATVNRHWNGTPDRRPKGTPLIGES